jgi:hypothetical protein
MNNEPIYSSLTGKFTECTVNNFNDYIDDYAYISGGPPGSEGCYYRFIGGTNPEIEGQPPGGGLWKGYWNVDFSSITFTELVQTFDEFTIDFTQDPNFTTNPNKNLFAGTYTATGKDEFGNPAGPYTVTVSCGCA